MVSLVKKVIVLLSLVKNSMMLKDNILHVIKSFML